MQTGALKEMSLTGPVGPGPGPNKKSYMCIYEMLGLRFLFTPFSSSLLVSWIAASIQLYICLCQSLVKFAAKPELDSTSWSLVLVPSPGTPMLVSKHRYSDVGNQILVISHWYSDVGSKCWYFKVSKQT